METSTNNRVEAATQTLRPSSQDPASVKEISLAGQPSLEDILRVAGPIAERYFESQERIHIQDLEFEAKLVVAENQRRRVLLTAATCISVSVLLHAGFLTLQGHDAAAVDLIKLLATILGVGFGGYGIAMSRRRREESDD